MAPVSASRSTAALARVTKPPVCADALWDGSRESESSSANASRSRLEARGFMVVSICPFGPCRSGRTATDYGDYLARTAPMSTTGRGLIYRHIGACVRFEAGGRDSGHGGGRSRIVIGTETE